MRAHYLQHVPFEGLGSIEPWLVENGFTVNATRLFAGEKLPAAEGVDFLIVMGGPMSVNDEQQHPWLVTEKNFIGEMGQMFARFGIQVSAHSSLPQPWARRSIRTRGRRSAGSRCAGSARGIITFSASRLPPPSFTGTGKPSICRPARPCSLKATPAEIRPFRSAHLSSGFSFTSKQPGSRPRP